MCDDDFLFLVPLALGGTGGFATPSILSASFVLCRRIRIRLYRRFQRLKFLSGGMRRSSPTACRPRPPGTRRLSRGKATRPMPCSTRCSAVAYNAHWIHVHVVATQLAGCASCMTAWSWTTCVSRAAYCAAYSPCDRASLATLAVLCLRSSAQECGITPLVDVVARASRLVCRTPFASSCSLLQPPFALRANSFARFQAVAFSRGVSVCVQCRVRLYLVR